MVIKEIIEKLESSNHPVAKSLHQGKDFKVLVIGFKKGMILKEHIAQIDSKLTVLEGNVVYKEEKRTLELEQYEEVNIPVDIPHSVKAYKDSLCILIQGE